MKEYRSFVDGLRYKDRDYRRHIMVKNDLSFSPIQNTLINLGISAGTYEYSVTQGSGFGYTEEYFIQNDSTDMPIQKTTVSYR